MLGELPGGVRGLQTLAPSARHQCQLYDLHPIHAQSQETRPGAPSVGGPRKEKKFSTRNSHWALIKISFIELLQLFRTLL